MKWWEYIIVFLLAVLGIGLMEIAVYYVSIPGTKWWEALMGLFLFGWAMYGAVAAAQRIDRWLKLRAMSRRMRHTCKLLTDSISQLSKTVAKQINRAGKRGQN